MGNARQNLMEAVNRLGRAIIWEKGVATAEGITNDRARIAASFSQISWLREWLSEFVRSLLYNRRWFIRTYAPHHADALTYLDLGPSQQNPE